MLFLGFGAGVGERLSRDGYFPLLFVAFNMYALAQAGGTCIECFLRNLLKFEVFTIPSPSGSEHFGSS